MRCVTAATLTVLVSFVSAASAGPIWLTSTGGFDLNRCADAIAVDETTIYVMDAHQAEMDTYDLGGNFLGTIALTGCETWLGGYTGATIKDADELYLTAMLPSDEPNSPPDRDSAVYTFTKAGACVNQATLFPPVLNTTSIAFDGTDAYLGQNDEPYFAYRANPDTGEVLQTFASNPGHGQRLGMAYWATGDLLIEAYDHGISVLNPADGSELQHLGPSALGHDNQIFSADVMGDTLYLVVNMLGYCRVFTYTIEPTTTYVVCPDGSGDFLTIQDAIDAANDGDDIELCDATFTGEGNRGIDFLGKAVTVRSRSRNPQACIIDCEHADRAFSFVTDEGPASVLEGVTIINGQAPGGWPDNVGGAIRCSGSRPTIRNCVFSGSWGSEGGGLHCAAESELSLAGCVFSGNSAESGGGMAVAGAWAELINCTFSDNSATVSGGGSFGGEESEVEFLNCTFDGNASPLGGGIYSGDGYVYMENCITAFSTQGAAIECSENSEAELFCCDVYGNAGGDWVGCIEDQFGIEGNICEDPLFCDPENEDFHIHTDSPCAPENNPDCGLIGAWPAGCCAGDVDGDDDTDLTDLALLLSAYGSVPGDPNWDAAADFDNDNDVDLTDLAFLLSGYGCGT
jgi:hypothetical protein